MSEVVFRKIQVGKEATRGTAVAATKVMLGRITMTPDLRWTEVPPAGGRLSARREIVNTRKAGTMRFESEAHYDVMHRIMAGSVKGGVTPVAQDVTAQEWIFTPSLTAKNTQDALTLEYGDNTQAWEMAFGLLTSWSLTWGQDSLVTVAGEYFGKFPTKTTFTAALTAPAVEEVKPSEVSIFIDNSWDTKGTTQITNTILSGVVRFNSGLVPRFYSDGGIDVAGVSEQPMSAEIELQLGMSQARAITEYDAFAAGTLRAIRIQFLGPTIAGTSKYSVLVDVVGKYMAPPEIFQDVNGEDAVRLILASQEDSSGNYLSTLVRNKETAVA